MHAKGKIGPSFSDFSLNSLKKRSLSFDCCSKGVYENSQNNFYENILYPSACTNFSPIIDVEKLRSNAWKGIPLRYRPQVWRIFLDYEPTNTSISSSVLQHKRDDYFNCLDRIFDVSQRHKWSNSQKQTEEQILKDLPRTPVQLLRNEERVKLLFERVLFVWAVRHPASGYVQGMNDILIPFFYVFLSEKLFLSDQKYDDDNIYNIETIEKLTSLEGLTEQDLNDIEADCFWCFSKLLDNIQDLFTKDQPGIYKMLNNLEMVVNRVAPALTKTIKNEEIQYQEFAFRWMNCLLVREFPMKLVLRIWDNYVCYPQKMSKIHVYICAAIMEILLQPRLKGLSHTDFIIRIQDPFNHQDSSNCITLSSESGSEISPLASEFISNSIPSSEVDKFFVNKRSKRSKSKDIHKSNSISDFNLSLSMNNTRNAKRKTSWDEQDIDMVIAQAFIYEKMFQSSAHLK